MWSHVRIILKVHLCLICIGLLIGGEQAFGEELSERPVTQRKLAQEALEADRGDGFIEVEPFGVQSDSVNGKFELAPYRDRRPDWTVVYGLSWGNFDPINYDSDFSGDNYDEIFDIENSALIELEFSFQKNMDFGSLGIDFAIGFYSASSTDDYVDTVGDDISISLTPIRMGARFNLDTIFDSPYVVPYGGGGIYMMIYNEELNSRTLEGNTSPAAYYNVGVKIQLNELEPEVAREAYADMGLQNTFFYIEARQFFSSSTEADPDFSSDVNINAGLSIEI